MLVECSACNGEGKTTGTILSRSGFDGIHEEDITELCEVCCQEGEVELEFEESWKQMLSDWIYFYDKYGKKEFNIKNTVVKVGSTIEVLLNVTKSLHKSLEEDEEVEVSEVCNTLQAWLTYSKLVDYPEKEFKNLFFYSNHLIENPEQ